jgi:hypothetical protein
LIDRHQPISLSLKPMLEPLAVVLVEGVSDQRALEARAA